MSEDLSNGWNGEGLSFVDLGSTKSDRTYPWLSGLLQPDKWTRPVLDLSIISFQTQATILKDGIIVGGGGGGERGSDGLVWPTGVQRFGNVPEEQAP